MKHIQSLWREDLSPLGREAAPKCRSRCVRQIVLTLGAAAQPTGINPLATRACWSRGNFLYNVVGNSSIRVLQMCDQATSPCASAYDCARIRRLVHLGSHRYFDSRHCPSVIGFSSSISKMFIAPFSQVFLHSMVAVRRAPSGAPVSWIPGLLTCVQLPLSSFSSEWVAAPTQGSKKHVQEHSESP